MTDNRLYDGACSLQGNRVPRVQRTKATRHRAKVWDHVESCTSEKVHLSPRKFFRGAGSVIGVASLGVTAGCKSESGAAKPCDELRATPRPESGNPFIKGRRNAKYKIDRAVTDEAVAGRYNNFYEFTTDNDRVWKLARRLQTRSWTGFAFQAFLDFLQPTSRAKFVRFITFHRPDQAAGQHPPTPWSWPYYEGLTIQEAANELTLMATGICGHALPNQHGAPLRMVLPWKYGYQRIESVVRIEFVEKQPLTFWNDVAPTEYDFWSNVNPQVPHPRWSQATQRIIGGDQRVPTLPYNRYGRFVHHLYKGTPAAAA